MIHFENYQFEAVIKLPKDYEVYDFTKPYNENRVLKSPYGIGKYNEKRPGMYKGELYDKSQRDIHVGIDIAAPVGTPVYSFYDGEVFLFQNNNNNYDYGPTIITRHQFKEGELYALYGHLSLSSLQKIEKKQKIMAGEKIAEIGLKSENGGWNPHLHFQLSYQRPTEVDLPGVVSEEDRQKALKLYPDPQFVLGKLY